ncbi:hypothetical protein ILUMI_26764, partial [Ignelater luminosus]
MVEKLEAATESMKKAPGIDGIPVEAEVISPKPATKTSKNDLCHIHELGRVWRARKEARPSVSKLVISFSNFNSNDYIDVIDCQGIKVTEPLLLLCCTDEESSATIKLALQELDFPKFS